LHPFLKNALVFPEDHISKRPLHVTQSHNHVYFSLFSQRSDQMQWHSGLPGWPFLGQTWEIWPCLKLVGLKNFIWPFGPNSSWLTLKISFGLSALFWLFCAEKVSSEVKYYYFIFSAASLRSICKKCYIRPTPALWY